VSGLNFGEHYIACLVGTVTLQRRTHPEVKIRFRDQDIENLSRMLIFIWNSGTADIRGEDVPDENWPLLTLAEGTRVLSVAVLLSSTEHIHLQSHESGDTSVQFTYSYLNPGDGGIVEVLYEGKSPSLTVAAFAAPLIGGSTPDFGESSPTLRKDIWLSLLETAGGLLAGIGLTFWFSQWKRGSVTQYLLAGALFIGGLAITAGANYLDLRRLHRRLPEFARMYLKRIAA